MEEPKKWYEDKARLLLQMETAQDDWELATRDAEDAASRITRAFLALEEIYKTHEVAQPDNDMDDDSGNEPEPEGPQTFTDEH